MGTNATPNTEPNPHSIPDIISDAIEDWSEVEAMKFIMYDEPIGPDPSLDWIHDPKNFEFTDEDWDDINAYAEEMLAEMQPTPAAPVIPQPLAEIDALNERITELEFTLECANNVADGYQKDACDARERIAQLEAAMQMTNTVLATIKQGGSVLENINRAQHLLHVALYPDKEGAA